MTLYLWLILGYLLLLMALNFLRARRVKSQEDFMVAGRTLSVPVMVFTLVCTWIGSGTFIAGAEYAYRAGLSSLWMPAGAWAGIAVIYFLAGKIRTFGQYTIGDILEVRYGRFARLFGAVALIISFITIVSYQFKAGGLILNVITQRPAAPPSSRSRAGRPSPRSTSGACRIRPASSTSARGATPSRRSRRPRSRAGRRPAMRPGSRPAGGRSSPAASRAS